MAIKTYLDSSVLINAFNNDQAIMRRSLNVLSDPDRSFVVGDYVQLEVMPKTQYHQRFEQTAFYAEIFRKSQFVRSTDEIIAKADEIATKYGLSAMDALHAASAIIGGANELITFEKPNKPFFRIPHEDLAITSLYGKA
jgi:predicted nucleic acid-binding protein